jgi:hypothetical protein
VLQSKTQAAAHQRATPWAWHLLCNWHGICFAIVGELNMIRGTITNKHLLLNALTIVRSFGLGMYLRCLIALLSGRPTTFLNLVWPS